jgi:Ca2+-binding EF-hand superfamily protein
METAQQKAKKEKIDSYLSEKKIPELFNRLLTKIIHDKPKDIKSHIIEQLTEIQYYQKNPSMIPASYFTSEDFENMFDIYDVAGEGRVTYHVLVQALTVAGVTDPVKALSQDFPELRPDSFIQRPKFTQVMIDEFVKRGYS